MDELNLIVNENQENNVSEDNIIQGFDPEDLFDNSIEQDQEQEKNISEDTTHNLTDYTDLLQEIIKNERDIITAIERKSDVVIPSGNDIKYGNNNQTKSVELVSNNNIMTTPIKDYTISESIILGIFIILLIGGFTILIRKAVGRWR